MYPLDKGQYPVTLSSENMTLCLCFGKKNKIEMFPPPFQKELYYSNLAGAGSAEAGTTPALTVPEVKLSELDRNKQKLIDRNVKLPEMFDLMKSI